MNLKCPYCNCIFSSDGVNYDTSFPKFQSIGRMIHGNTPGNPNHKNIGIMSHYCPECNNPIMWMYEFDLSIGSKEPVMAIKEYNLLFPKYRYNCIDPSIPEKYAKELNEAILIIDISPKASAALSRRCLQKYIEDEEKIVKNNLVDEIKELIAKNTLPKYLSDDIDSIRVIGNFGAHPKKSENSGEIIEVEAGEAEWLVETLDNLLQFHFVQQLESENRRKAFQDKYRKGK
jgi:hypothetical protein